MNEISEKSSPSKKVTSEQMTSSWISLPFEVQETDPGYQLVPASVPDEVRVRFADTIGFHSDNPREVSDTASRLTGQMTFGAPFGPFTLTAKADSEGSWRTTLDAQASNGMFGQPMPPEITKLVIQASQLRDKSKLLDIQDAQNQREHEQRGIHELRAAAEDAERVARVPAHRQTARARPLERDQGRLLLLVLDALADGGQHGAEHERCKAIGNTHG